MKFPRTHTRSPLTKTRLPNGLTPTQNAIVIAKARAELAGEKIGGTEIARVVGCAPSAVTQTLQNPNVKRAFAEILEEQGAGLVKIAATLAANLDAKAPSILKRSSYENGKLASSETYVELYPDGGVQVQAVRVGLEGHGVLPQPIKIDVQVAHSFDSSLTDVLAIELDRLREVGEMPAVDADFTEALPQTPLLDGPTQ